jgi:hypothetical protein
LDNYSAAERVFSMADSSADKKVVALVGKTVVEKAFYLAVPMVQRLAALKAILKGHWSAD